MCRGVRGTKWLREKVRKVHKGVRILKIPEDPEDLSRGDEWKKRNMGSKGRGGEL